MFFYRSSCKLNSHQCHKKYEKNVFLCDNKQMFYGISRENMIHMVSIRRYIHTPGLEGYMMWSVYGFLNVMNHHLNWSEIVIREKISSGNMKEEEELFVVWMYKGIFMQYWHLKFFVMNRNSCELANTSVLWLQTEVSSQNYAIHN